jgi:hypothetical protein
MLRGEVDVRLFSYHWLDMRLKVLTSFVFM